MLAAQLRDQHVDGLIASPVDPADEFWPELAGSLPVVCVGDAIAAGRAAGEVLFDNRSGVRAALEHLGGLGHRRIAVLCPPGAPTADRPAETFVATESRRLGLNTSVVVCPYELIDATAVARGLLRSAQRPSAIFCLSDSIAYGVYAACRALEIAIPDEVSIIGYDDHPVSALLVPALSSFDWSSERVAAEAVGMVLAAIEGRPARRRIVIEPVPRLRESTGPNRRR